MNPIPELEVVRSAPLVVRAADAVDENSMPIMEVRFSPFETWYEIDSWWEGRFLERTVRGAFAKTIAENRDRIKCLYDHGFDPQIGNKVLGTIEDLREDPDSGVGDVQLFDTTYVRDLLPGLQAGVYGSSMRMRVIKEEWNEDPGISDHNPQGLPERSILEIRMFEFGPVTFPANGEATAGVRSMTDDFYERLRSRDPQRVGDLELVRNSRTLPGLAAGATTADPERAADNPTNQEPAAGHSGGLTRAQRERLLHMNVRKHGK
jgi:HK97 family phage prohead protease